MDKIVGGFYLKDISKIKGARNPIPQKVNLRQGQISTGESCGITDLGITSVGLLGILEKFFWNMMSCQFKCNTFF